jgi:hypothetical protein
MGVEDETLMTVVVKFVTSSFLATAAIICAWLCDNTAPSLLWAVKYAVSQYACMFKGTVIKFGETAICTVGKEGVGLTNTRERIAKIYGAAGHLSLRDLDGGEPATQDELVAAGEP